MAQLWARARKLPWSAMLLSLAVVGPPLAIGGVFPSIVPAFVIVVVALSWRAAKRRKRAAHIPWASAVLLALAAWTAVQWLPIPGLRELFAPQLATWVQQSAELTDVPARSGLSISAADTGLEVARLVGLAGLVFAAAQVSWRVSAAAISAAGLLVAGVGLAHELLGSSAIYGLYVPQDISLTERTALLGTFINPNHQSGLLLLAVFATAALAIDQFHGARVARDIGKVEARADRAMGACGALLVLIPALLLSLSRGALLAFVVIGPIALVLGLRELPGQRSSKPEGRRWRVLSGAFVVALVAVLARHSAWSEFTTMITDPGDAFERKLGPAREALGLLEVSPVLGIGRGGFVDLFARIQAEPDPIVFTHLESAPVTALVEWGVLVGPAAVIAAIVWWFAALRRDGDPRNVRARRVFLLGVAAVLLQNIGDFSLEFLGVAAPVAAAVGALSPRGKYEVERSRLRAVALGLGLVAVGIATVSIPHTWARRAQIDAQIRAGEVPLAQALERRPLDGTLLAIAARDALSQKDPRAAGLAELATQARPSSIDAWLALAQGREGEGASLETIVATRRALDLVREPVPEALLEYVVKLYPTPSDAAVVAPPSRTAWYAFVRALRAAGHIEHADALAEARAQNRPEDPSPLLVRSHIALERHQPALALHFARLARQVDPSLSDAHLAVARATAQHYGIDEALSVLDEADTLALAAYEQDRLDEFRVRMLVAQGTTVSLNRAARLAEALLLRSTTPQDAARRRALLRSLPPTP